MKAELFFAPFGCKNPLYAYDEVHIFNVIRVHRIGLYNVHIVGKNQFSVNAGKYNARNVYANNSNPENESNPRNIAFLNALPSKESTESVS